MNHRIAQGKGLSRSVPPSELPGTWWRTPGLTGTEQNPAQAEVSPSLVSAAPCSKRGQSVRRRGARSGPPD